MTAPLKVGVVGVGSLGQWHARVYAELPDVTLAGVYDVDAARAREIADRYHTRVFAALDDLLAAVEAVSIATPPQDHCSAACRIMAAGRHVLVEKPIAATPEEAERMVALAREKQVILQVGHIERFNPVYAHLERLLTRPRYIEAMRLAPYPPVRPGLPPRGTEVSVVLDLMIHDIDIVLQLVRSPVRELRAVGVPVLSPFEDVANAWLAFENGCVASITASRISAEKVRRIRAFQPDTHVALDYANQSGHVHRRVGGAIVSAEVPIEKGDALASELRSFVDCVRQRGEPVVSGEHGQLALNLALAICQHIRQGVP